MFSYSKVRGFTLIELMVAVAIVLTILSILSVSFFEARQNSRDRQRVSDLTQLQFALSAYNEVNGRFPILATPTQLGNGYIGVWEGAYNNYWDEDIEDPLFEGGHASQYMYRVYPVLVCGGQDYYAVVAINMEAGKNANGAQVCPGNSAMSNAHVIIVYGPIVDGGSINYDIEDGDGTDWWDEPDNQTWLDGLEDGSGGCAFGQIGCGPTSGG